MGASGDRAILLTGMMGCGKSTVGERLARRLGWDFVDTDTAIEASSGMSVAEIFEREGEAGFRAREREALVALPGQRCVVALGGGAIVAEENRSLLRAKGRLVWLDASPGELAKRLGDQEDRPLLAGLTPAQRVARLGELQAERRDAYAQADVCVQTDGLAVPDVCDAVIAALGLGVPQ